MQLLTNDLILSGPFSGRQWPNFSKLADNKCHCHLIRGKATYIACWKITDKKHIKWRYIMSVHMRAHPTKIKVKFIFCVSQERKIYNKNSAVLRPSQQSSTVTPEQIFAEINTEYTKIGALLEAVRLREGLNQKEFAAIIKVTQGDLSKMEQGKRPVGKAIIARIAEKFGSQIE